MQLNTGFATYEVEVINNNYINNGRIYLGLRDKFDGTNICDLTENHPDISDEDLQFGLVKGMERCIIDRDFIDCMGGGIQAKEWLVENLKCMGGGMVDGYFCIIVTDGTIIGERG